MRNGRVLKHADATSLSCRLYTLCADNKQVGSSGLEPPFTQEPPFTRNFFVSGWASVARLSAIHFRG